MFLDTIDWTTVITSAIVSAIVTSANYITIRYLGKILDRIEKRRDEEK